MNMEDRINLLKNLKNNNNNFPSENLKKVKNLILEFFKKELLQQNSENFRDIVNLAIDLNYSNPNFISKVNKYYGKLENSPENRKIKNTRFLVKIIELNCLAQKSNQIKNIEEYLGRINKLDKVGNWGIKECVIFFT